MAVKMCFDERLDDTQRNEMKNRRIDENKEEERHIDYHEAIPRKWCKK